MSVAVKMITKRMIPTAAAYPKSNFEKAERDLQQRDFEGALKLLDLAETVMHNDARINIVRIGRYWSTALLTGPRRHRDLVPVVQQVRRDGEQDRERQEDEERRQAQRAEVAFHEHGHDRL